MLQGQLQSLKQSYDARANELEQARTKAMEAARAMQRAKDEVAAAKAKAAKQDRSESTQLQRRLEAAEKAQKAAEKAAEEAAGAAGQARDEAAVLSAALQAAQTANTGLQHEVEALRQHAKAAVAALHEMQQQQAVALAGVSGSLSSGTVSSPDRMVWGSRGTTPDHEGPDGSSLYSHWNGSSLFSGGAPASPLGGRAGLF